MQFKSHAPIKKLPVSQANIQAERIEYIDTSAAPVLMLEEGDNWMRLLPSVTNENWNMTIELLPMKGLVGYTGYMLLTEQMQDTMFELRSLVYSRYRNEVKMAIKPNGIDINTTTRCLFCVVPTRSNDDDPNCYILSLPATPRWIKKKTQDYNESISDHVINFGKSMDLTSFEKGCEVSVYKDKFQYLLDIAEPMDLSATMFERARTTIPRFGDMLVTYPYETFLQVISLKLGDLQEDIFSELALR